MFSSSRGILYTAPPADETADEKRETAETTDAAESTDPADTTPTTADANWTGTTPTTADD